MKLLLSWLKKVMEKGREKRRIFSLENGPKKEYKTQTPSNSELSQSSNIFVIKIYRALIQQV